METEHGKSLGDLPAAQVYFNMKNKKDHGLCIICRKPTPFNLTTEKYERLHTGVCTETYRKQFVERMKKKYGKEHLLDDPAKQVEMLKSRKISGVYEWSRNPNIKIDYTGSYEKDFLEFLDLFMNWDDPNDICSPSPVIVDYKDENNESHFWIPDYYIKSLDLLIEIKGSTPQDSQYGSNNSNTHEYRQRELKKEVFKDQAAKHIPQKYIKIVDKDYSKFFAFLLKQKNG